MKKTVLIFIIVSIFAKLVAFGRELVLAYYYGAGQTSDVFLLSMTLPVTIFGFVAVGVTSGFIPIYQRAKIEKGKETAERFTNNVINILVILSIVIIAIYLMIPKLILGLFANGFDDTTLEMARVFTNISIWVIILTAIVTVLTGYLQINDRIKITALISVPLNIGLIVTIVIAATIGNIYILPIGFLLSSISQVVFAVICSARVGFRYSLTVKFKDEYVKNFFYSLALLVLSGSLQQINVLIDRTLATTVTVGGLSVFEYGNRISDFVMGLTIVPISSAIFPMMAKAKEDSSELKKTLEEGIRLSSVIIIPAAVLLVVYADVIVRIMYFRGAFSETHVSLTTDIVRFYGVGLFAFSLREMILKCFYAIGDIKSPLINSSIGVACNIILNFLLLRIYGVGGLALATSIAALVSVVLLYISLRRRHKDIIIGRTILRSIGLGIVSMMVGYASLILYKFMKTVVGKEIIVFIIVAIAFFIVYMGFAVVTGMINKNDIKTIVRRR